MKSALKCVAFAAVTVVGFGVTATTHADGTTPLPAGGLGGGTAQPNVSGFVATIARRDQTEVSAITRSNVQTMSGLVDVAYAAVLNPAGTDARLTTASPTGGVSLSQTPHPPGESADLCAWMNWSDAATDIGESPNRDEVVAYINASREFMEFFDVASPQVIQRGWRPVRQTYLTPLDIIEENDFDLTEAGPEVEAYLDGLQEEVVDLRYHFEDDLTGYREEICTSSASVNESDNDVPGLDELYDAAMEVNEERFNADSAELCSSVLGTSSEVGDGYGDTELVLHGEVRGGDVGYNAEGSRFHLHCEYQSPRGSYEIRIWFLLANNHLYQAPTLQNDVWLIDAVNDLDIRFDSGLPSSRFMDLLIDRLYGEGSWELGSSLDEPEPPSPEPPSDTAAEEYALAAGYQSAIGHVTFTDVDCADAQTVDGISSMYECQADSAAGEQWTVLVTMMHDGSPSYIGNGWRNLPETGATSETLPGHAALSDLVGRSDVAGHVGPIVLPDGTQVAVITRSDDSTSQTGTVELAVDHGGDWLVEQTLAVRLLDAPVMVGDLTGDDLTEIVVRNFSGSGARSWDVIYRIDPEGPTLKEIPFAVNELEPLLGTLPFGLTVYTVQPDTVSSSVVTCEPSCADDPGTDVEWYLDRSGSLILRPVSPPPPPVVDPSSCDTYSFNDQYPIRRCDEGYAVYSIQVALIGHGYTVDVDGYFGPATEQAVRDFQRNEGFEVDGLVGPDTWSTLVAQMGWDLDGNGIVDPDELAGD